MGWLMIDTLEQKERKAKKQHRCDYCCGIIEIGELYNWSKHVFDGEIYVWKSHKKCQSIVDKLKGFYISDDGITEDDFQDWCKDFCYSFVCPACSKWNKEYQECDDGESFCTDKIYDFLMDNELYEDEKRVLKVRKREG